MVKKRPFRAFVLILFFGVIAIGGWIGMYIYTSTCRYIVDYRLIELVAGDQNFHQNLEQWIRQNYGYLTWGMKKRSVNDVQIVYWETPFQRYSIVDSKEGSYANVLPKVFAPTMEEIFRCIGTPEYYEATSIDNGISYWNYAALWYPEIGFGATREFYPQEFKSSPGAYKLNVVDQYDRFYYTKPKEIETILNIVFGNFHYNLQEHLDNTKPWPGLEDAVFEYGE